MPSGNQVLDPAASECVPAPPDQAGLLMANSNASSGYSANVLSLPPALWALIFGKACFSGFRLSAPTCRLFAEISAVEPICLDVEPYDGKFVLPEGLSDSDITVKEQGSVVHVPDDSCHGGTAIAGDVWLSSGVYGWCIEVTATPDLCRSPSCGHHGGSWCGVALGMISKQAFRRQECPVRNGDGVYMVNKSDMASQWQIMRQGQTVSPQAHPVALLMLHCW